VGVSERLHATKTGGIVVISDRPEDGGEGQYQFNDLKRFGNRAETNYSHVRFEELEFLVPGWEKHIDKFRLFYHVGNEFIHGSTSIRAIAKSLEKRALDGVLPAYMRVSAPTLSRACLDVRRHLGKRLNLNGEAPLCVKNGVGREMSGFTELGWRAWAWIRKSLIRQKLIDESD
jgi:hypothetical protein